VHAVRLVQAVDRGDARMVERGEELCFPLEARQALRIGGKSLGQDLDRHFAIERRVRRLPYDAHRSNIPLFTELIGVGSFSRMAEATLSWLFPSNARFPVSISYNTAPSEKISERASSSLPSTCSGDMYWNVPTIVPSWVKGDRCGAVAVSVASEAEGIVGRARPKSRSFAPVEVSMMLPGFRSRCTTPLRCALSSASAICIPYFNTCSSGRGPFLHPLCQCFSLHELHHQVIDPILTPNVMQHTDVWMIQARDGFGFALEALLANQDQKRVALAKS
jgi:hypothetical protein